MSVEKRGSARVPKGRRRPHSSAAPSGLGARRSRSQPRNAGLLSSIPSGWSSADS